MGGGGGGVWTRLEGKGKEKGRNGGKGAGKGQKGEKYCDLLMAIVLPPFQ